jgi:predicted nucleotidyltransferase
MIDQLLQELKTGLESLYGKRLKGIYLFGSYARGDQNDESDLDVLIVLDEVTRLSSEIKCTSRLASDLSLKYGVSISRKFMPEIYWLQHDSALLRNVRREAVAA